MSHLKCEYCEQLFPVWSLEAFRGSAICPKCIRIRLLTKCVCCTEYVETPVASTVIGYVCLDCCEIWRLLCQRDEYPSTLGKIR